ncbi:MAG: hypothetical protein LQ346_002952 [Caloplaca aetnensis]|nr:MAG: hypothetical protein LQ346_002952 [Caloplaca aetnensis]
MSTVFKPTELFGGAINVALPDGYADVSNIREVPDHQEIYLDASGFSSIIIEIAERVLEPSTDEEALKFHFHDIVEEHDTSSIYHTGPANLANLQLIPQSTDIVVTINIPHIPREQEPSDGEVNFAQGKYGSLVEEGLRIRDEVWRTLDVKDWGLFGTPAEE